MILDAIAAMLNSQFKGAKGIHMQMTLSSQHSKQLLEQEIKPTLESFFKERGLERSPEKTVVTHITKGFDFLGQNVRKYPDHRKLKLLIKPSDKSIPSFQQGIKRPSAKHVISHKRSLSKY